MKKIKLDMPVVISQLKDHTKIKADVLALINSEVSGEQIVEGDTLDISNCDYKMSDKDRSWTKLIQPYILENMTHVCKDLGYDAFKIYNIWFQQYNEGSTHGWHIHTQCQWSNVYYLDMPEGSPQTQLINPWNQTEVITMDVKEGDVLTFPSFVIHRAPVNENTTTKTIVSFNSDVELDYGK